MSKKKQEQWKNRIIGYDEVDADQLLANPLNHRIHPLSQQKGLSATLGSVGWVQNIIVNKRTGHVIDGHLRTELSISKGEKVPVAYVDLSEEEERTILATFDPIGAMAAEDRDKLDDLLKSIQSDDEQVMKLLEEIREENGIIEPPVITEDEAPIDKAEELQKKWQVTRGQVWEVPSLTVKGKCHRVMCGDSTDVGDVTLLMGGEKADMVFTDPPYGIKAVKRNSVGGGGLTKFRGTVGASNYVACNTYDEIEGDGSTEAAEKSYALLKELGVKDFIIFGGNYFTDFLPSSPCWVIWDKENTGNFADVEMAWTSFNKGAKLYRWLWNGLSRKGDRKTELQSRVHPTQKPVGLFCQILADFQCSSILDPFLGSGTTLIAAEQTGRICYGMEIAEKYVSVILERCLNNGLEPRVSE